MEIVFRRDVGDVLRDEKTIFQFTRQLFELQKPYTNFRKLIILISAFTETISTRIGCWVNASSSQRSSVRLIWLLAVDRESYCNRIFPCLISPYRILYRSVLNADQGGPDLFPSNRESNRLGRKVKRNNTGHLGFSSPQIRPSLGLCPQHPRYRPSCNCNNNIQLNPS